MLKFRFSFIIVLSLIGMVLTASCAKDAEEYYIANFLQVIDVEAKYCTMLSGDIMGMAEYGPFPGIRFKCHNTGTKTITQIKVTVIFKDAANNTISEQKNVIVFDAESDPSDDLPIKPNDLWEMKPNDYHLFSPISNKWQEGNIELKITDIDFAISDDK